MKFLTFCVPEVFSKELLQNKYSQQILEVENRVSGSKRDRKVRDFAFKDIVKIAKHIKDIKKMFLNSLIYSYCSKRLIPIASHFCELIIEMPGGD